MTTPSAITSATTQGHIRSRRQAMALPAVLLLVFVGLGVALGIHRFSTETYRRTSRGTYATMSEVLAESAVEEAWYTLQRDVNTPTKPLYKLFRSDDGDGFADLPVELPVLKGKLDDSQFVNYLTDRYDAGSSFRASISMVWTNPYGNKMQLGPQGVFDAEAPWERVGVVTIKGSAQARTSMEGLANFRRMIVKRPFRLLKTTPPVPFDRSGLVIVYPEHVTDVKLAGLLDDATQWSVLPQGGKSKMDKILNDAHKLVDDASKTAKDFNDKYKDAASLPFGDHLTPPPKWLDDIIKKLNGLVSSATKLDLQGNGRRPFLFDDEVMVARASMENGFLGNLGDFNYGKNIKDKLGPLNDLMKALQGIADINSKIISVLAPIHRSVPYGAKLDLLVTPLYALVPECVGSVKSICEGLHEKIMDPVLEILVGVGQVLAIAQKIIIEVPMMGQQAFAGFQSQIQGVASNQIGQVSQNLDLNNAALQGLPTNTGAMGFALNMPLPNYTTGEEMTEMKGMDAGEIVKNAGEGLLNLIMGVVEKELVKFITEQMAALTLKLTVSLATTTAACAGPQAIVACIPAKAALALAFDLLQKAVMRGIGQQLNRISSFKGNALNQIVYTLTRQVPVFKSNPILQELKLEDLLGKVLQAAFEKEDVSQKIEEWVGSLSQTFAQKMTQAASSGLGLDKMGGVLKGYVLRHRFRNLVEFDNKSGFTGLSGGGGSGLFAVAAGSDGLNRWRSAFDRVYAEGLWRRKATWIVKTPEQWEGLLSRYFDGKFPNDKLKDPSGDGSSAWKDDSYKPNKGYGLSGVVFYDGTAPLKLNFTGERAFIGKLVLYAPKAPITVDACKMRSTATDVLTVICGKPVKLPPTDVEISVHAIGSSEADCQVEMTESTKIFGSVILKRYTVANEGSEKASLKGELTYNKGLNGTGGDAIGGMKESHLFVTISPYVISREMETQP